MPQHDSLNRLKGFALAGLFGALVLAGSLAPARAEDDDEWADQKFIRGILSGLGLKRSGLNDSEIEYRERSPLVVPPSRDLPPPETASPTASNPAWPVDQDETRRKAAAKRKRTGDAASNWEESQRQLRPDELNNPGGGGDKAGQQRSASDPETYGNPMKPSELGYKGGLFSFGSFFGGSKEEQATFEREPTRSALTDPPVGYRTPSPSQPYGIGTPTAEPAKPVDPYERQNASTGHEK
jgi:hypothetical protein